MKALKIFGMAILACSVLFVSCKKDDKKDDTTTTKSYTITVNANNATMGTVTGGGTYKANETATLTATANAGYQFVQWQDGNKDNPRKVTVTADATYTATFQALPAGVSVTFEGSTWTAAGIEGTYYASESAYDVFAGEDAALSSFPIADVCSYKITTGSESDTYDENNGWTNSVFAYLEYYKEYSLQSQSGYTYGDWWGKTATMNVSAFDATALTLSASVNAVMFSAYEAYVNQVGMADAPTTDMVVNMNGVQLEASSSKASFKKSFNGKLRVK